MIVQFDIHVTVLATVECHKVSVTYKLEFMQT